MSSVFPSIENSLLVVVDVQERLMPVIHNSESAIQNIQKLIDGASILGMDFLVTEQYPKGLGHTVAELTFDRNQTVVLTKDTFSCMLEPSIVEAISKTKKQHLILCGAEAHICVLKTALEAVAQGYTVHVVADAVSSRTPENKNLGLERMRQSGVYIVSLEMILFMLIDCAGTDQFRAISKLIK
ncbi:MAG: hydrolase [Saprospiraceae bacterium]|nr:MAG: nicotinamidase [Bacteroidetes bacterium OLB9]MCO6463373.1 hydrolase [Saprospiraceae bacterium]MCZ2338720.1 hydrolase [Chitinophagales bacterium]